jgi:hypothetical protein
MTPNWDALEDSIGEAYARLSEPSVRLFGQTPT